MSLTDDELMAKVSQGSDSAFMELFDRHGGKVLGYAKRLMGNHEKAEDISQKAWLKVIRQAQGYHGDGQFIAWIYTVVRNTAFNEMRKEKNKWNHSDLDEIHASVPDSKVTIEELLQNQQQREQVIAAVDALPEMQRVALVTYLTEELSYEEIARQLSITVSAVKSLLFRARQSLQSQLGGEG